MSLRGAVLSDSLSLSLSYWVIVYASHPLSPSKVVTTSVSITSSSFTLIIIISTILTIHNFFYLSSLCPLSHLSVVNLSYLFTAFLIFNTLNNV